MNKRIIYTNEDGGVTILVPAPSMFDSSTMDYEIMKNNLGKEELTEEEIIDYILAKDIPEGKVSKIVTVDKIPADRFFRNAWEQNGEELSINLPKAKTIKLNQFRALREPLLEALDLEYIKADERSDLGLKADIVAKKNALRDVTLVTLPDDIETLKTFIPEILNTTQ